VILAGRTETEVREGGWLVTHTTGKNKTYADADSGNGGAVSLVVE